MASERLLKIARISISTRLQVISWDFWDAIASFHIANHG
jgi:hypothetical protein